MVRDCALRVARYSPPLPMMSGLLRTMRPHQWVKNLPVLAPVVFALHLFDTGVALRALAGFGVFCILVGAVYVLNDLVDVEADRLHPVKKNRPIASGQLTVAQAKIACAALATIALAGSLALGWAFLGAALGYFLLNVAYSFKLKNIAYLDVLCIAAGFELRVLAGSFAAQVPPSAYLLLCMGLAAAFLGLGKRSHELAVMELKAAKGEKGAGGEKKNETRKALGGYHPRVLAPLLYACGAATLVTYVVYTLDPDTIAAFGTSWLVGSAVFAAIGLGRFVWLVQRKTTAESPTDAMLRDPPFLASLASWGLAVVLILYFT